jgi:formylglycine-generating enzyme required for sulfatase activity
LALTRVRPQTTADGETLVEPTTGMAFVFVPAGEFEMGSTEEEVDVALALCNASYGNCERGWFADEQPQHTVALDAYWIGQTEVTNAQFQQFVDAGGYAAERYWSAEGWQVRSDAGWEGPRCLEDDNVNAPDQPVVCVSWYEADAYTRWLSESTGETYRLPTEAEWEKAARGTDGRTFPWGEDFDGSLLNFCDTNCVYDHKDETHDDGYAYTAPVGSYPEGASPYGVMDMAGNVWEWVNDWYDSSYYSQSPSENPPGPATGEYRVLRGGSWYSSGSSVRSAIRLYNLPDLWDVSDGFRCVRSQ